MICTHILCIYKFVLYVIISFELSYMIISMYFISKVIDIFQEISLSIEYVTEK